MQNGRFTIVFLNKDHRICEEKDAYFVDITERDENGHIVKQVIGGVDREAIKKEYENKPEQK